ncbi:STE3-domain-containing protein [Peniophora sp. CONT]|nr:STE3-domain-containing protein [Peniophora sp. CONT]
MGKPVDPSYPLYPIACVFAATGLFLVLLTSFVRSRWNLGVSFLCFWLFLENLTFAVNSVVWADNGDIKHPVYCDLASHLQTICYVVKPAATLIMTRRLYLIASFRNMEMHTTLKRSDLIIEWFLGLGLPLLVAGPIYYIIQTRRFTILEGFGPSGSSSHTVLAILLFYQWSISLPLISIVLYFPKVVWIFYRQSRDMSDFFLRSNSNSSTSRSGYLRLFALASVDMLATFPVGIVNVALVIVRNLDSRRSLPFYDGWTATHRNWAPHSSPYSDVLAKGRSGLAQFYFSNWVTPVLSLIIFALFGTTLNARKAYMTVLCWFGDLLHIRPIIRRRRQRLKHQEAVQNRERTRRGLGSGPQEITLDSQLWSRELSFADFELTAPAGQRIDAKDDAEARKSEDSGRDAIKVYSGPGDSTPALTPPKSDSDKPEV